MNQSQNLKDKQLNRILEHFNNVKLKTYDKNINNNKIFQIMENDKKNLHNKINIILLKDIGKSIYHRNIKINLIKKITKNI